MKTCGKIIEIKRLKNSLNGNPAWSFILDNGFQGRTAPNASISYVLSHNWENDYVLCTYHRTPTGRTYITDVELYDSKRMKEGVTE